MTTWPKRTEAAAFYGSHELGEDGLPTVEWQAAHLVLIQTPYPFRLSWDPDTTVRRVRCHTKVSKSLERILQAILTHYGSPERVRTYRADLFGGCYQFRAQRGSTALSLHSWGAAVDLDPERNQMGVPWRDGRGMLERQVIQAFQQEGWFWGGDFRKRPDPMHFEAVTP
jgi:hypothetical protein